jgi:hypothetical protein
MRNPRSSVAADRDTGRKGFVRIGSIILAGGLAILAWQTIALVHYGRWPAMPFGRAWLAIGLPLPGGDWERLPIVSWLFQCPASAVLLVAGGALVIWGRLAPRHV